MPKRGGGRGAGRGAAPSARGGRGRGGSRASSGSTPFPQGKSNAPRSLQAAVTGHGGLGFGTAPSKSKENSNKKGIPFGDNPLLRPVAFVRGTHQAFDMSQQEEPAQSVPSAPHEPAHVQRQHDVHQPHVKGENEEEEESPEEEEEQGEAPPAVTQAIEFQPDGSAVATAITLDQEAADVVSEHAEEPQLSVPPQPAPEEPAQDPQEAGLPDDSLFVVDVQGQGHDQSAEPTQAPRPSIPPLQNDGDDDEEDEDQIVYVPPTQPHKPSVLPAQPSQKPPSKPASTSTSTAPYARVITDQVVIPPPAPTPASTNGHVLQPQPAGQEPTTHKTSGRLTSAEKRRQKREGRKRRKAGITLPFGDYAAATPTASSGEDGPVDDSSVVDASAIAAAAASHKGKEDAVLRDYLYHTSLRDENETGEMDEDFDVTQEQSRMASFLQAMASQAGHTTIDELQDAEQAVRDEQYFLEREAGGWRSEEDAESDSDSDDDSEDDLQDTGVTGGKDPDMTSSSDSEEDEGLAQIDMAVDEALARQLDLESDSDDDGEEDATDHMGIVDRLASRSIELESSDEEFDEGDPFAGGQSWTHNLDQHAGPSKAGRKANKKKFKAISKGDFMDVDGDIFGGLDLDLDEDLEDDFTIFDGADKPAGKKSAKGKKKKMPQLDSEDEFFEEMQAAWEKDRKAKADRKRQRMESRLQHQPTKKTMKAAKRAGFEAPTFHGLKGFNIHSVHDQIREFIIAGPRQSSDLSFSPMDKKDRVAVHLLAESYGLKSQSRGKGVKRFPILSRTTQTTVLLGPREEAKIENILAVASGRQKAAMMGKGGKQKGLWKALQGMDAPSSDFKRGDKVKSTKNREGEVVGGRADHLSHDNVGYQLLARMGWNHGQSMGATGKDGIAVPLAATIKTTRRGLGG